LIFGDLTEGFSADGARFKGLVVFVVLQAPGVVVEEDAAADDAFLRPGSDA
jgi:hypothetical protein